MAVTATEQGNVSDLRQVVDGVTSPSQKWFSLQDNKLDGTYKPVPSGSEINWNPDTPFNTLAVGSKTPGAWRLNDAGVNTESFTITNGVAHITVTLAGADIRLYTPEFNGLDKTRTIRVEYKLKLLSGDSRFLQSLYASGPLADETTYDEKTCDQYRISAAVLADGFTHYIYEIPGSYFNAGSGNSGYFGLYGAWGTAYSSEVEIKDFNYGYVETAVGWWGTSLSDGAGLLSASPKLEVTFSDDRSIGFIEDWDTQPYPTPGQTTVNSVSNGVLNVTSTGADAMINMYALGSFDPNTFRYIEMKYRVVNSVATNWEVFFTNTAYPAANAAQHLPGGALVADGKWHIAIIDCWAHAKWKDSNVTGWRLDWATASGVNMEIDHVALVDTTGKRSMHQLKVSGDDQLNEYPVDFSVKLYDGATLLHTENVSGNSQVHWSKALPQVFDVTKYEVTVTKVNKPARTVKLLEASNSPTLVRSDTLGLVTTDAKKTLGNSVVSADNLGIAVSDVDKPIQVSFKKQDALSVATPDSSYFEQYAFKKLDGLNVSTTEASDDVINNFKRTDALSVGVTDRLKSMTVSFNKADTLSLEDQVEDDNITVEFTRTDSLNMVVSDVPNLRNIHTVMDEDFRQIFGKVEITYTDPFLDEDVTVVASTTAYPTAASETTDTKSDTTAKWFSLQENKLDGSYNLMPTDLDNNSVGWWGAVLSDANGVISPTETLRVEFSTRGHYELKVVGDNKLNEFPVDFDIVMYNPSDVVVHTEQVRGNTQVLWNKLLADPITDVAAMELKVYKINKPNRTVKIVEFFAALTETYDAETLISIDILEEQSFDDMTLPIGNASANEIEVRFDNTDRRFDAGNTESPLNGWLKKNRRIKAWLGAEIIPDVIEWYPMGVYWAQEWNAPESAIWASVTGLDRLELLRVTDFSTSQVYVNQNLYDIAEIILLDAGLKLEEFYIDPALQSITVPYIWFNKMSHRAALVKIAQAALGRVYCDREGKLILTTFSVMPQSIYTYDYDKSIVDLDRPLALAQLTNQVNVKSKPRELQPLKEVYRSTEIITLAPGQVYTEVISFSESPAMNVSQPVLTGDTGVTVTSFNIYAWGAEMTLTNTNATQSTITQVEVQGQPLTVVGERTAIAKDDKSIRDNGKQSYELESDFIQSYQVAQTIAQDILETYSNPRHDAKIDSRGNIALRLGDRVSVPTKQGTVVDHFLTRQSLSWEGSLESKVDAQILA